MISKKQAKKITKQTGWNIIPMPTFYRDDEGNKHHKFIPSWQEYRSKQFPLKQWERHKPQGLAILTGEISDLTVLDIDSLDALNTIIEELGCELKDLANYIVKTNKGYQLFYSYMPNTSTKIGIKHRVDFLSGGLTFAHPLNEGYELLNDTLPLQPMPKKLQQYLTVQEDTKVTPQVKAFEMALKNDLAYRYPLAELIKECVNAKRFQANYKWVKKLSNVFCTKDFKDFTLQGMGAKGIKHASTIYVGSIVASNVTVSEDLYLRFMQWWHTHILLVDLKDTHEQQLFDGRVKANMEYWQYDEDWEGKSKEAGDISVQLSAKDYLNMYLLPQGRYVTYNSKTDGYIEYPNREDFRISLSRLLKKLDPEVYKDFEPSEVKLDIFSERHCEFIPNDNRRFLRDEEKMIGIFNTFSPTKAMLHFDNADKQSKVKMPKTYKKLIDNVIPVKEEQELFLHNLAHHLTYRTVPQTMFVLTGAGGAGKTMLLGAVGERIYGNYFLKTSVDKVKGNFRNQFKNKLWVFIDEGKEVISRYESATLANELKALVANSSATFEGKNQNIDGAEPHHAFYTLATNTAVPFKLDEGGDRRTNIFKTKSENLLDVLGCTFTELDENLDDELEQFLEYLRTIKLEEDKLGKIIHNAHRQRMVDESKDPVVIYVEGVLKRDPQHIDVIDSDTFEELETLFKMKKPYIESSKLTEMFGKYSGRVKKELSNTNGVKVWKPKLFGLNGTKTVYDFSKVWED